jgi:hypothetical protein
MKFTLTWLEVLATSTILFLAGCASNVAAPIGDRAITSAVSNASAHGERWIEAACPNARAGHAQCAALFLHGRPDDDGASGPNGGFAPADLQAAYNLPSTSNGNGQIVAIVEAYDSPNAASDLATYRSYFGMPAANFSKFNQDGQQSNYPASCTSSPDNWCGEFALDPQMVSAVCPNCAIDLIEANSDDAADLGAAEAQAVKLGAHIVSNSWNNYCDDSCEIKEKYFKTPGVVYVAAGGDYGYAISQPAEFGNVVAVGGTHLIRDKSKRGWNESAWGGGGFPIKIFATGSGCGNVPKPAWQHDSGCAFRTANDVAAVADPATGVAIYQTYGSSDDGWRVAGGDSVASPIIAGIFALAGNASSQVAGSAFWQKAHERSDDLNPVLHGSDGHCSPIYLCTDGTGAFGKYGGPTGWGTPNGLGAF